MRTLLSRSEFSVQKAHAAQTRLSRKIITRDKLPERIRYIAGVDIAYTRDSSIGAVSVLDYGTLKPAESQTAICKTRFTYVPTLLSFRETPPAVSCIKKLRLRPDVFLVDGHGLAHPYRCGFASHLGLVIGRPTIGVAKSRLCGEVENGEVEGVSLLKYLDETVGAVVNTKRGFKPVYVSIGHMVSIGTAIQIVKHCVRNSAIPEPILRAHQMATFEKRNANNISPFNR